MGISPLGYDLPLWPRKSEGVDIFGLRIRRLVQAYCNGSILRSQGYFLLLFFDGQFDTDRNVPDCLCSQVATSIRRLNSNRFPGRLAV